MIQAHEGLMDAQARSEVWQFLIMPYCRDLFVPRDYLDTVQ